MIDSLNARSSKYDDEEETEEESKIAMAAQRVTRARGARAKSQGEVHNIAMHVCPIYSEDDAHIQTVAALSLELNNIQRETRMCTKCKEAGHFWRACPSLMRTDGTLAPFCPYCKESHPLSTCPKLALLECRDCKNKGHTARFCPKNACPSCGGPHPLKHCKRSTQKQ